MFLFVGTLLHAFSHFATEDDEAKNIRLFVDTKADPCVDFFQFACGGYSKSRRENETPESGVLSAVLKRTKDLITVRKPDEAKFFGDEKIRNFYKACIKWRSTLSGKTYNYFYKYPILCKSYQKPYGGCKTYKTFKAKNSKISIDLYLESLQNKVLKKVGLERWPFTKRSYGKSTFEWYEAVEKMIESGVVNTDQNGKINMPIINIEIGISDFTKDEYYLLIECI